MNNFTAKFILKRCVTSPWTVRLMDLESSPASLETTHSYTAVSSTVGAITTREPDDSNLAKKMKCQYQQKGYRDVKPN